jgi:quinol monooxygenase YgiN
LYSISILGAIFVIEFKTHERDMIRLNCVFQATDSAQYHCALEAAVALTEKSLQHEGCISYDVLESATRKNVFLICETWQDEVALGKHGATPEFKHYVAIMQECGTLQIEQFVK